MPTISVVIPAYNAELTILDTIKSVQKQTFSDIEVIVINDGSTDRTVEILQSIQDERLKFFSYENSRASGARNHGISHATGEFISFLDADDLWTPDKLELQITALEEHPEAGVAYSWTYTINERGEQLYPIEPLYSGNVYADLLLRNFLASGSNPLIRKEAIESVGKFDPTLKSGEDWDYWLRLASKWPFVVVPRHQIFYRRSSTSKSYKLQVIREAGLIVLEKSLKRAGPELQYLRNQCLSNIYQYNVQLYLESINNNINNNSSVDINYVMENLLQAIRLYPKNLLTKSTQKLIIKFLLALILSPSLMSHLIGFARKTHQTK